MLRQFGKSRYYKCIGNISRFLVFSEVDAYDINKGYIEIAKKLLPNVSFYNQCIINEKINKTYDMVISHLPFNARMNHGEKTEFFENLAFKKAFDILDDKGYLIMLVPITFLYTKPFKRIKKYGN